MNHNGTSVNTKVSKPSTLGTKLYSVTLFPKSKDIPKFVEKNDLSKSVTSHLTTKKIIEKCTKVLAPGLLKIESEPINAYFKNNRVVHRDYLKVTKEHVATLQELLEEARALKPLDEYIGRVSSTNASGSKPKSNIKNDRILQPSSRRKKNKVEAHHRKFKSSSNKKNHVSDCNANVKNVSLSKNFDTICLSCNKCLFFSNHDACVVQYLKKMQKHKVAKSAKQKVKREWKPIGRIVKNVGLKWIPTEDVGITHNTSTARTPQQNGVVKRRNRMLVEATRTMLIFSKSPLFLWVEAVATTCYTQNHSLVHTRYNKTPYELLRDRKPELKYLHVFGALCYPTNDFEDLEKLQPKADIGIFIGYSPSKKAYRIYNKRTRQIMETMNVQFYKHTQMASEQHGSGPDLHCLTSRHISSGLVLNQVVSTSAKPPTKND
ncbi:retrovirus-related pol polyprotein from transposon TNT 1-94 [Tanacetum coccineum]